jgi:glutathione S-transferase
MIKIHHLNFSRSTRIIWLMEELGEPYELVPHTRNPNTFRSPPTLDRIHPLGKAPVIEDGALVMAESGAIIEYVIATYGHGKLAPAQSGPAWARYIGWLHFAEGSAMMPLLVHLLGMLTGGLPDGIKDFIAPDIEKTLKYIGGAIPDNGYLMGDAFSGADIQMSYVLEVARRASCSMPIRRWGNTWHGLSSVRPTSGRSSVAALCLCRWADRQRVSDTAELRPRIFGAALGAQAGEERQVRRPQVLRRGQP